MMSSARKQKAAGVIPRNTVHPPFRTRRSLRAAESVLSVTKYSWCNSMAEKSFGASAGGRTRVLSTDGRRGPGCSTSYCLNQTNATGEGQLTRPVSAPGQLAVRNAHGPPPPGTAVGSQRGTSLLRLTVACAVPVTQIHGRALNATRTSEDNIVCQTNSILVTPTSEHIRHKTSTNSTLTNHSHPPT
jgi:hypothetical protein